MTLYKVADLKNDSIEGLISKLVYNSVEIAHKGGKVAKRDLENEKRIVKELENRIDIDANVLLEKISK